MTAPPQPLRLGTSSGRWVVATTVMGTGVAMLNGTDVSVALPDLGADLDASVAALQWVLNGYMLTLASLILVGGSLADRFGRRRIYLLGVAWFTVASVLCALAPSSGWLIAARILQGVGGALLTPGSLAILQSCFHPDDRATAIGAWSGLTGIAAVIGPVVGGLLVDAFGWRAVFFLPLPLAIAVIWAGSRHVPESRDPASPRLDWPGALLTVAGLGTSSYAIIAYPESGWSAAVVAATVSGLVFLVGFVVRERVAADPMLPLSVFRSRQFTAANLITFVVYAALGGVFFMLIVHLQTVVGYSATGAGAATMPVSGLLLVGSPLMGRVMQRIGPRLPLTVGNALLAAGMLMMMTIREGSTYLGGVLPPLLVFGVGLTLMVTPVTATVLSAIEDRFSGLASGVNNAVARTGQLLAVAALPVAAGLTGGDFADPVAFAAGFRIAMVVSAVLTGLGALLAWTMIRNPATADTQA
ncbi:MAG TPA: DHA2 family efflux MFS transporter permease subunit [Acidimicrobiia bacterium]